MKKYTKGFTLIEMSVSLGIFSIVILMAIGIFIGGSNLQRKVLELHSVQREGGYLMETMSRELRMATGISDGSDGNSDQRNNNDSSIEFTNYNGNLVRYCRANASGTCTDNDTGSFLSYNEDIGDTTSTNEIINSSNITIEHLRFYVTDDFSAPPRKQPFVTISMKVKSTGKYKTELELQSSIAMRLYY